MAAVSRMLHSPENARQRDGAVVPGLSTIDWVGGRDVDSSGLAGGVAVTAGGGVTPCTTFSGVAVG